MRFHIILILIHYCFFLSSAKEAFLELGQSAITSHHGTKSWPRCCLADFGSRIKISAHLLGQNHKFFEPDLFRLVPGCGGGWSEVRPIGNSGEGGSWGRVYRSRAEQGIQVPGTCICIPFRAPYYWLRFSYLLNRVPDHRPSICI